MSKMTPQERNRRVADATTGLQTKRPTTPAQRSAPTAAVPQQDATPAKERIATYLPTTRAANNRTE